MINKLLYEQIARFGYETSTNTLNLPSENTINYAFNLLDDLSCVLIKGGEYDSEFWPLQRKFYKEISHHTYYDKYKRLDSIRKLDIKYEMLESLSNVRKALSIIEGSSIHSKNYLSDIFDQYFSRELSQIEKDSELYQKLSELALSTIDDTIDHKVEIIGILELNNKEKTSISPDLMDHTKPMLLWYGTKLCNWSSLLIFRLKYKSRMLDKYFKFLNGIRFSDVFSKAIKNCILDYSTDKVIVGLYQVSAEHIISSKFPGFYGTDNSDLNKVFKIEGKYSPINELVFDNATAFAGPLKDNGFGYYQKYNEYTLQCPSLAKLKYLFIIKLSQ